MELRHLIGWYVHLVGRRLLPYEARHLKKLLKLYGLNRTKAITTVWWKEYDRWNLPGWRNTMGLMARHDKISGTDRVSNAERTVENERRIEIPITIKGIEKPNFQASKLKALRGLDATN